VWAYAHTPVFGYPFNFCEVLIIMSSGALFE
jgi:hypothetical protein